MKNTVNTKKSAPRFVDDTHVLVTKEFAKNARIFGTAEYKMWKEIRMDNPGVELQMVTKTIKKNPDKKTSTKNMTYENMAIYIREQKDAKVLMEKFQKQVALSKVQANPYRCVLAWFCQTFKNYDSYKEYFEKQSKREAEKNNIYHLADFATATIEGGADDEDQLALASGND